MSGRIRTDVPPATWEVPAGIGLGWLCSALLLLPVGRGCAAWLVGGGWVWPHGSAALGRSVTGLLGGRAGAGLTAAQVALLPGSGWVYSAVVLGEVLLVVGTAWAAAWWWRRLGPGARAGMATGGEVEAVLGLSRLRGARRVIRPDLYGSAGSR